jgi:hypothetical protein
VRPDPQGEPRSLDAPWLVRVGRGIVHFQPLLVVELLRVTIAAATLVPLVALTASRVGNVALARAAVSDPERLEDRALSHGVAGIGAIAVAEVLGAAVSAILFVTLARAYYAGRAVHWPGLTRDLRAVAAVTAVYVAASAAQIGLTVLSDHASAGLAPVVLVLLVAFVLLFAFADVACATERLGPVAGIRASLRMARTDPRSALPAIFAVVVVQLVAGAVASGLVDSARDVTILFLPGWLIAQAVLAYVGDVVLLEVWRGRTRPGVSDERALSG